MSYPITPSNSFQFKYRGMQFALAALKDSDFGTWSFSLYQLVGDGWDAVVCDLPGSANGLIQYGIGNADIEKAGSVHDYIAALLPKVEALLRKRFTPVKPDPAAFDAWENKVPNIGYDLAMGAVHFDGNAEPMFTLDPPPLPHAQ